MLKFLGIRKSCTAAVPNHSKFRKNYKEYKSNQSRITLSYKTVSVNNNFKGKCLWGFWQHSQDSLYSMAAARKHENGKLDSIERGNYFFYKKLIYSAIYFSLQSNGLCTLLLSRCSSTALTTFADCFPKEWLTQLSKFLTGINQNAKITVTEALIPL